MSISKFKIISQLKSDTLSLHIELQSKFPFSRISVNKISADDYHALLMVLKKFHGVVEPALSEALPASCLVRTGFEPLYSLLCQDLRQAESMSDEDEQSLFDSSAEAMGGLYVMMGASAGAVRIIDSLQALEFIQNNYFGTSYYARLAQHHLRWAEFKVAFEKECQERNYAISELCNGANIAFGHILSACDGRW